MFHWMCILSVLAAFPAQAQISVLRQAVERQESENPKPSETPDQIRARLEKWHREAQEALERLSGPGAETSLPAGITREELDARVRDLEQTALIATRSIKNLTAIEDARKALENSRAAESAWKGFEKKPPYSLLMVDELLNERDAIKDKLTSYEASLLNYQSILAGAVMETKAAEDAAGTMVTAVQNAREGELAAAQWRLQAARGKSRLATTRAGLLQSGCENFKDLIAAAKLDLALIERKVKTARANARLTDEDLAKIEKIANERKRSLQKEIGAVSQRLKAAQAALSKARAALQEPGAPEREFSEIRAEVAEDRVESLQSVMESLESLVQVENFNWKAYQRRSEYLAAANADDRKKALAEIQDSVERLRAWESVLKNDISSGVADLSKLESRAATVASDDPRFPLINDQRNASNEKLNALRRLSQTVSSERRLIERWVLEYTRKGENEGVFERVTSLVSESWEFARKAWAFEVMSFDDSYTTADGVQMPGKIPVTLGMLLRAILFFAIGYFIASRVANRIQNKLVERGHMMDAQARTLRNWAMIVVGVFLILGTLAFLRIPLTVFAFFGGALAIGLGFGLQTLIKNFISGIIVLIERKVRVGDILDVDGIVGTVVEVNTRSSVIRSPDDVETMIPNSMFLENRVTNWTLSSSKMRRNLRVGVAYGSDTRMVMDILTEAAERHGKVCKDPSPFAVFEDFGDSALVFSLYFWVEMGGGANVMVVTSDLRLMIEKRLGEAGIGVPFPQRDLHLKSDQPIQVRMTDER